MTVASARSIVIVEFALSSVIVLLASLIVLFVNVAVRASWNATRLSTVIFFDAGVPPGSSMIVNRSPEVGVVASSGEQHPIDPVERRPGQHERNEHRR